MPETTPLIKAALNLRVGAGFDVYYAPFKYPDYNASNYRGEYSYREKWW